MFLLLPLGLDEMRVQRIPRLSLGIAIACVLSYLATFAIADEAYGIFGMIPAQGVFQAGMLSSLFVHAGLVHLLGNLLFLYLAAAVIEDAWGGLLFFILYVVGGVVANLGQLALDPTSTVPVVGASGAIAACMGALVVQFPGRNVRNFYFALVFLRIYKGTFFVPVWAWGLFWLLSELAGAFLSGATETIAFGAHVAGFAFGALMAAAVVKFRGSADEDHTLVGDPDAVPKRRPAYVQHVGSVSRPRRSSTVAAPPRAEQAAAAVVHAPDVEPTIRSDDGPPRAFPKAPKPRTQ